MAITLKKLSGDTEVVANPTLDGSETALSGLQIDGVKYAMGGGGSALYEHNIYVNHKITNERSVGIYLKITNGSATPFTQSDFFKYLKDVNNAGVNYGIGVSGFYNNLTSSTYQLVNVIRYVSDSYFSVDVVTSGNTTANMEIRTITTFVDRVVEV